MDSLPSLHSLHSLTSLTSLTSLHFTINFCRVDPLRATPSVDDQRVRGRRALKAWHTEGLCDPAFLTRLSRCGLGLARFARSPSTKKKCFFYSKRASRLAGIEVETQKNENRPTYGDFGIWLPESPTSPNFKTHKRIILHNRNYIACKVYTYPITYLSFIKI